MKFKESLRKALLLEVEDIQDRYGATFEEDGPPEVAIKTKKGGAWLWVNSKADYSGATWDPSTDRLSGDPYSAHVYHDWVGDLKEAPKTIASVDELNSWALLHTRYKRQYTDVGSWGVHSGRWVDDITSEGIVKLRVESKMTFQDVSPVSETTSHEVDLSAFSERSLDILLKLLKDDNPFVREISAKLLGTQRDVKAVGALIETTDDESRYVQAMAIIALGKIGGDEAFGRLKAMLFNDSHHLDLIVKALIELGESILDELVPAFEIENERVPMAFIRILEGIGSNKAISILHQYLSDERISIRARIIKALGQIESSKSIDVLIKGLEDIEPEVQRLAAQALGKLKDKRVVEPLVKALLANYKWVRSDAAKSLEVLGWQPSNSEENIWYIYAKQEWKKLVALGESATEMILRAMDDDDRYVRGELLRPISKAAVPFTDPRIVESIIKIYSDKETMSYRLRDAIKALGNLPILNSTEFLISKYLQDEADSLGLRGVIVDSITDHLISGLAVADTLIHILKKKKIENLTKSQIEIALELFNLIPISHDQIKVIKPWLEWIDEQKYDYKSSTKPIISGLFDLEYLTPDLSNDDIRVREKAIGLISKIKIPSVAFPLIYALEDDNPLIRERAAAALSKLGVGPLSILLTALSNEEAHVRIGAAEALGGIRNARAAKYLLKALRDKHRVVRQNAAWALGELYLAREEYNELRKKIIQALTKRMRTDDYFPVRFNAVYALSRINDSRAVIPLLEAMDNPAVEFRLNASFGFIKMSQVLRKPSKLQSKIIDRLILALSDEVDRVRYNAVDALRMYGGKKALIALTALKNDDDIEMRQLVERSIEEITELGKKERRSWQYSVRTHYELRYPDVIEDYIHLLCDDDESVQLEAQKALGRFGQLAFDRLMEILQDENEVWLKREGAAGALGRVGDKRAVKILIKTLKDDNEMVRCNSAWALAELKDKRSLKALLKATKDKFWMVRVNAAAGVGKLGGQAALDVLLEMVDDERPEVRVIVTSYIAQFKDSRVIPALRERLNDESEEVRKMAEQWLGHLEKKES